jgi:hypothetical protein
MASKWEPYKDRIKELYLDQKKTLQDVTEIVYNEMGFSAR